MHNRQCTADSADAAALPQWKRPSPVNLHTDRLLKRGCSALQAALGGLLLYPGAKIALKDLRMQGIPRTRIIVHARIRNTTLLRSAHVRRPWPTCCTAVRRLAGQRCSAAHKPRLDVTTQDQVVCIFEALASPRATCSHWHMPPHASATCTV